MLKFISTSFLLFLFALSTTCQNDYEVLVLGNSQDGGYPQYNCSEPCCMAVWNKETDRQYVASLAIIDKLSQDVWLIDCTPDLKEQMHLLSNYINKDSVQLRGILLTHAHIGHYAGLLDLGREVTNSRRLPVYVMPRMRKFIETNGPWNQLVSLENIVLHDLTNEKPLSLAEELTIMPFIVPHRDEYSETVGFSICGNDQTLIYIPDIDKWSKWDKDIKELVSNSNFSLLDGTFYNHKELINRDISEIPHPSVSETMTLFKSESTEVKRKIYFTHFNHTNPLHRKGSTNKKLEEGNFNVANQGDVFLLQRPTKEKKQNHFFRK